ncbi:MAG TPA: CNP1-like family protein [Noviherbaspirillum sp.]|nr:CNP1-like family protein [Noviherbaspirillum sp.]
MAEKTAFFAAAAAVLITLATASHAQSRFEEDFDDKEKPWQEIAVQLPAAPQQADLVPFYVSATATQSFAIDTRSLSVGQDGVIRYTLVAISDAGAKNVSYEGIRCATYERKLYAFGRSDGSWSRSRRDQWERIQSSAANRHHAALTKDFFCVEKTIAGTGEDIVRRLRAGQTLAPHSNR